MPKLLYTWYFEKFTASVTSSGHSALRHEVSRICTILHIVSDHSKFTDFQSDFHPSKHYIEFADGSKSSAALKRGTAYVSIKAADGRLFPVRLQNTLMYRATKRTSSQ